MSRRDRADAEFVDVAGDIAPPPTDWTDADVVGATQPPAARAYGRLSRLVRRPAVRLAAQCAIALGVGVAVMLAVVRGPSAGNRNEPIPPSPLAAPACGGGQCSTISLTTTELSQVEAKLPRFSTSGLRLLDTRGVPVQIEVVSTDGIRVVTINAARGAHAPSSWVSDTVTPVSPGGPDRVVVHRKVTSADGASWVVEAKAIGPSGSTLLSTVQSLAVDRSLIG
jgi:hypothetical protein